MTQQVLESKAFYSDSNLAILFKAYGEYMDKHPDRKPTKLDMYYFLKDRGYPRHGRSWAVDRVQHDLSILCDQEKLMIVREPHCKPTYWYGKKGLWE